MGDDVLNALSRIEKTKFFGRLGKAATGAAFVALSLNAGLALADLPSVTIGTADLLSPTSSQVTTHYGASTTHTDDLSWGRPAEVKELARALRYDVDLIYEFVRNKVEITPLYGLQKGALGAVIDRHGTAFDQAHLMVELLKESDSAGSTSYAPKYKSGRITLNATQFEDWLGITNAEAACRMLADGGVPATVNGSQNCSTLGGNVSSVTMAHIWVEATVGGTAYLFDPAYKTHTFFAGVNLASDMGFTTSDFTGSATVSTGTLSGVAYATNVSTSGVNSKLETYASNLLTKIGTTHAAKTLDEIVGGQEIEDEVIPSGGVRNTSLAGHTVTHTWTAIPDQYRTKLTVWLDDPSVNDPISHVFYVDEIYGRRLELVPDTDTQDFECTGNPSPCLPLQDVDVRLQADRQTIATHRSNLNAPKRARFELKLTVDHPYAADSGAYMDDTVQKWVDLQTHVTIVNGWGHVSPNYLAKLSSEMGDDEDLPELGGQVGTEPESVLGSTQNNTKTKLGASWLAQLSRMMELQAAVGDGITQHHHSLGAVFAETFVGTESEQVGSTIQSYFFIGDQVMRLDVESGISINDLAADGTDRKALAQSITSAAAALEGSVVEQILDEASPSSVPERFEWGQANYASSIRYYLLKPGDQTLITNGTIPFLVEGYTQNDPNRPDYTDWHVGDTGFISQYLAEGYNVLAANDTFLGPGYHLGFGNDPNTGEPTLQRGAAALAFKADASEIANVVLGRLDEYKGGGGGSSNNHVDDFNPSEAADILKDRFEDRSQLHGVDLATGSVSYNTGTLVSSGTGEFPYNLEHSWTFQPGFIGGRCHSNWTSNWHISASLSGSGMEAMGASTPSGAVSSIVSFIVAQDMFREAELASTETAEVANLVRAPFVYHWWLENLTYNVVSIQGGNSGTQFVRLADGSFEPPQGSAAALTQTGARTRERAPRFINYYWDYDAVSFSMTLEDGSVQTFGNFTFSPTLDASATEYHLTRWEMPTGFGVDVTYEDCGGDFSPRLRKVENDYGHALFFSGPTTSSAVTVATGDNGATTVTIDDITDPANGVTKFEYAGASDKAANPRLFEGALLARIWSPDDGIVPALEYYYGADNRVRSVDDAQRNADQAASAPSPRPAYDFFIAEGHRGEREDPLNNAYTVYYDHEGRAEQFIDELGRTVTAKYDNHNRITERAFPEGDKSLFDYDSNHNVTKFTRVAKPGSGDPNLVAEASYDQTYNKPLWVKDFEGNITYLDYGSSGGAKGQVTFAYRPCPTDGDCAKTNTARPKYSFTYDANGRVLTTTDPEGMVTRNAYHTTNGRLTSTIVDDGGLGLTTSFSYDAAGNVSSVDGPRTDVTDTTTATYDGMRRPLIVTDALGNKTDNTYDPAGRLEKVERLNSASTVLQTTTMTYTPTGLEAKIIGPCLTGLAATEPACGVTEIQYDDADRREFVIDPENRKTRLTYDAAGQLLKEIRAHGTALVQDYATYTYSDNGQQTSVTDANGNRTDYFYDGHDRLEKTQFPSPTTAGQSNASDYESFTYDKNGNVLSLRTRAGQTITSTYDALQRITQKTPGADKAVAYAYDKLGRQTQVKFTDSSHVIDYVYDDAGRLTSATDDGPSAGPRVISYQYDKASNRTRITHPDTNYFVYAYDAVNRVTTIKENGTTALATYAYDDLARRTSVTLGNGLVTSYAFEADSALDSLTHNLSGTTNDVTFTFNYNKANQVTTKTVSNSAYAWTPAGDKTESYTPNGLNQYAAVNPNVLPYTLSYDGNGSLTGDGVWEYAYDVENRLKTAIGPGVDATYAYDPVGRRSSKTVDGNVTSFLSDQMEEILEYDGNGGILRRYVYGPAADEPVVMYEGAHLNTKEYFHVDWLGSVIAMTDTAGVLVDVYTYSGYGQSGSEGASGSPYRFTGRRIDPETGLYYYRARYYSPVLGRFLQSDPVGYGDNMNMYAYIGNDPVNGRDPSGMVSATDCGQYVIFCRTVAGSIGGRATAQASDDGGQDRIATHVFPVDTSTEEVANTLFPDAPSEFRAGFAQALSQAASQARSKLRAYNSPLIAEGQQSRFANEDVGNFILFNPGRSFLFFRTEPGFEITNSNINPPFGLNPDGGAFGGNPLEPPDNIVATVIAVRPLTARFARRNIQVRGRGYFDLSRKIQAPVVVFSPHGIDIHVWDGRK